MCWLYRRGQHVLEFSGPSEKANLQTRPLAAPDPAAACHSHRRRAPPPLPPSRITPAGPQTAVRCSGPTRTPAGSVTARRPGPPIIHRKSSCCLSCNTSIRWQWTFPDFTPTFLLRDLVRIVRFHAVIVGAKSCFREKL